jgi:hypothetical protein
MERSSRADSVSAWAIGIGVGLIALQITWLIGNRSSSLVWGPPLGPSIAFASAILVGIVLSVMAGRRLVKIANPPQP